MINTKILIVDDSELTLKVVRDTLKNLGYDNITIAHDAKKALSYLLNSVTKYDIVICDWKMPNMSGLELLQEMKMSTELMDIPFILLTGENKKSKINEAISKGVNGYVMKPFTSNTLHERIQLVLNRGNQ